MTTKSFDDLKNKGALTIGADPQSWHDQPRTVIILGVARSGTSIVSGAMHHLGAFVGDEGSEPVFEDQRLKKAIESGSWKKVDLIIEDYNKRHSIWCYKKPDIVQDLAALEEPANEESTNTVSKSKAPSVRLNKFLSLHRRLRNPIYLIIFRDIFAIANRNRISVGTDIIENMHHAIAHYKTIVTLIEHIKPNALLLSSEKVLTNKKQFLEQLVNFCGLTPTQGQLTNATNFITKDPKNYILKRAGKCVGFLDRVQKDSISGWVKNHDNEDIVTVTLTIDGHEISKMEATLFRQDLVNSNIHSTGKCAFSFEDFDSDLLKEGCEVRVRAVGDTKDINNSPFYFGAQYAPSEQ